LVVPLTYVSSRGQDTKGCYDDEQDMMGYHKVRILAGSAVKNRQFLTTEVRHNSPEILDFNKKNFENTCAVK
jgi:hypothetical protein